MHQLRLSTQPRPCAVPAAEHHMRNMEGEYVQQALLQAEGVLLRQAGPMTFQAGSILGHLSSLPTLNTSVALLSTPPLDPWSCKMQQLLLALAITKQPCCSCCPRC